MAEQIFIGKLKAITNDRNGVTKKNEDWSSVDLVLEEVKDKFPQSVVVKCGTKLYDQARMLKIGSMVTVHYNFKANEYQGKFYNNIEAWKLEGGESVGGAIEPKQEKPWENPPSDDLPFRSQSMRYEQ